MPTEKFSKRCETDGIQMVKESVLSLTREERKKLLEAITKGEITRERQNS